MPRPRREELLALLRRAEAEYGVRRRRAIVYAVVLLALAAAYLALPPIGVSPAPGFSIRVVPEKYVLEVKLLWVNYTDTNKPVNATRISFNIYARGGVNETLVVLEYVKDRDIRVYRSIRIEVNSSRLDLYLYDNATSRGLPTPILYPVGVASLALPPTRYVVTNYLYVASLLVDLYINRAVVEVSSSDPVELHLYTQTEDEGWVNTSLAVSPGESRVRIDESRIKKILYRAWITRGPLRLRVERKGLYFRATDNAWLFAAPAAVFVVLLAWETRRILWLSRRIRRYKRKLGLR